MGERYCPPPPPPPPEFPPTIILSCTEVPRAPSPTPQRSTFCFVNTQKFLSVSEIEERRKNWNVFEKVENFNSAVLKQMAETVPAPANNVERAFYKFQGEEEKRAYRAGQALHLLAYPTVSDLTVPYANKPIPYTSSVVQAIQNLSPNLAIDCKCPAPVLGKPVTNEQRIESIKSLNTYIKVSTHNAQFPKSQYRFSSADEYLQYKRYRDILSQPPT